MQKLFSLFDLFKILFLLALVTSCGKPIVEKTPERLKLDPYASGVSEELILQGFMSLNFDLLPLSGKVYSPEKLWSGDAWRLNRGAINYRWNSPEKIGFNYLSPTSREAMSMSAEKLMELSPAEKYDIYMGRYDYPLKMEVDSLARTGTEQWEGLCHGWAGATINHKEPGPVIMTNPDGIEVPFGISDIKALLTYAYSKVLIDEDESVGKRCGFMTDDNEEDFCDDDLSAITFHAVVTNRIGLRGESFIADMDRYREVWNHPVVSYESEIKAVRRSSSGKVVTISTKLTYLDITENHSWEKSNHNIYSYMTVKYELTVDHNGNMIDGRWLSHTRPDFLWIVKRPVQFAGYLSGLESILKK